MSKEISAVFENSDMAEYALMRMREIGIALTSFRIRPLHRGGGDGGAASAYTAGLGPTGAVSSVSGYGGAFLPVDPDAYLRCEEQPSEEVALHVLAEDIEAGRVESSLISSHGRRVTVKR